jgi:hypothetical protein
MVVSLRKIASFARWRLVPVRYATMLMSFKWATLCKSTPVKNSSVAEINSKGYTKGPVMDSDLLRLAQEIYEPRGKLVVPKLTGHPFVNLFNETDIRSDNPVFKFAFSTEVLDAAADYFGGRLILDSIQVLYSYPTEGDPRESQYWHLDYGDSKSFHCVAYLKDVLNTEDGPFVYVDKPTTQKIGRSLIVRRISDQQFSRELKDGEVKSFLGKAGSSVLVDPSACYHYGSRCKVPRIAIFVTFSSWYPFAQPMPLVTQNSRKILEAARQVRPDLSEPFIKALLQLD